jgi:hypothetical protein
MRPRRTALARLDRAVADAVAFFADADKTLADGHQAARDVLSHFVFWHREYVRIVRALVAGRPPRLRSGKFREMNAQATREFKRVSLLQLAKQFGQLQPLLERLLLALPDWRIGFPIKAGGKRTPVAERVPQITAHIGNHIARLRRAQRRRR